MANELGIDSCWINNDFSWFRDADYIRNILKPTYIIDDIEEIPEIFE